MKLYLSAPMTGYPQFNFPLFDEIATDLRPEHEIVSPADHDREVVRERTLYLDITEVPGYADGDVKAYTDAVGTLHDFLVWDFAQIAECDGIVMGPKWEESSGARAERFVAEALGKQVFLACKGASLAWKLHEVRSSALCVDTLKSGLTARMGVSPTTRPPMCAVISEPPPLRSLNYGTNEVRVVDPSSGGAKGAKAQAMHLLPGDALLAISEHLNKGAEKYAARNWERGYAFSLSFAAMQRHLWAWWQGEDDDPEFGWSHLRAVGFHALTLLTFELRGIGTDDRPCS